MKKEWKKPDLETLDVNMTMKGWKPGGGSGGGKDSNNDSNNDSHNDSHNDSCNWGIDS